MSRAHINSRLQISNQIITADDSTILLDKCNTTDFISTRGLLALLDGDSIYPSRGAPYHISPYGITIASSGINMSPTGNSYILQNLGVENYDGGLAYKLLTTPKTMFCRFKTLDIDTSRDRYILMLYDVSSIYVKVYAKQTTGNVTIEIRDGTNSYYASSPINICDTSWHTVGVIINTTYIKSGSSDTNVGYSCRLIVDGLYFSQTINSSNIPYPTVIPFPSTICIGFDALGNSGNIAMSDIRCDTTEYLDDDISGWSLSNKQFYDPYDYNSFVY